MSDDRAAQAMSSGAAFWKDHDERAYEYVVTDYGKRIRFDYSRIWSPEFGWFSFRRGVSTAQISLPEPFAQSYWVLSIGPWTLQSSPWWQYNKRPGPRKVAP